jgi:hypothetical protein
VVEPIEAISERRVQPTYNLGGYHRSHLLEGVRPVNVVFYHASNECDAPQPGADWLWGFDTFTVERSHNIVQRDAFLHHRVDASPMGILTSSMR